MSFVIDGLIGVAAGFVVALALALASRGFRLQKASQARTWFGSSTEEQWFVSLPRFYGDQRAVSFKFLAAVDTIGRLADSIGCKVSSTPNDELQHLGDQSEISIGGGIDGGPAVHLKTWVPNFELATWGPESKESHAVLVAQQPISLQQRTSSKTIRHYESGSAETHLLSC